MKTLVIAFLVMLALSGIRCGGSTTGNPPNSSLPSQLSMDAE